MSLLIKNHLLIIQLYVKRKLQVSAYFINCFRYSGKYARFFLLYNTRYFSPKLIFITAHVTINTYMVFLQKNLNFVSVSNLSCGNVSIMTHTRKGSTGYARTEMSIHCRNGRSQELHFRGCHGLKSCVVPNFICWPLNVVGSGGRAFGR